MESRESELRRTDLTTFDLTSASLVPRKPRHELCHLTAAKKRYTLHHAMKNDIPTAGIY